MASSFVHLHLHTRFSLLDGANQIEPLVQQIKLFGQPVVAMTDQPSSALSSQTCR